MAARLWSRLAFCSFSSSPEIFFCLARSAESCSFKPCRHAAAILDAAPGLYFSSASFARIWSRSLESCATLRSVSSRSSGFMVFCMRTDAAASSSRSIALSGRHRPLTYRADSFAAATTALSLILIAWCCSYFARRPRRTETVCASSGSARDLLEPALERGVLLDGLLELLGGGRADALEQPAAERGLEDGSAVVPRGRGGAQVVDVVDEHHHRALLRRLDDLGDHDGEALLELAGHLAPRAHRAQVELEQPRVAQGRGDVPSDDPLRQTLHDRGLTHAGLAQKNGVVLRAAGEDVDDAAHLVVAPHQGIQHALLRLVRHVSAEALERGELLLGLRAGRGRTPGAPPAAA